MYKILSRIISFLLVFITNIKAFKIDISFLGCFSLARDILRYNSLFSHSFNV